MQTATLARKAAAVCRWRRALAALGAAVCAPLALGQADFLQAGAQIADCASALRVGPVRCDAPDSGLADARDELSQAGLPAVADTALEARVDEYLRQYGKPPREAVRALLDPSDRNIERYLMKQQQMLAVVSYVAARMSSLQAAADAQGLPDLALPQNMASFMQMRLTLVTRAGDPQGQAALAALRQLLLQAPAIDARVQLLSAPGARSLQEEVARVPPPLTVIAAGVEPSPLDPEPPFVRVEDLRLGRSITLDARDISAAALRAGIVALRSASGQADGAIAARTDPPAR